MNLFPNKEPRLEAFASGHTGQLLEELSGLAGSQGYESDGPWLSAQAEELLFELGTGSRPGRFALAGKAEAVAELEAAGLVNARARLTEQGQLVASPLDSGSRTEILFSGALRSTTTSLQCVIGSEGVLVLAGPSGPSLRGGQQDEGRRQLDFLTLDQLFPALAGWLGIGPAWPLVAEGTPAWEQVQARVDGAGPEDVPPPADADAVMRHIWQQEWFFWQASPQLLLPAAIQTADAGTYALLGRRDEDPHPRLEAWPSGQSYRQLTKAILDIHGPLGTGPSW